MATNKSYEKLGEVYDKIYGDKQDFYENYLEFVKELTKSGNDIDEVLEMACGTGNLMKVFENDGYNVDGFDISQSMLDVAESKGMNVVKADLRDFELEKTYDLLLCIFDSLNYLENLEELENCFKHSYNHLNDSGYFVFDLNSRYFVEEATKEWEGTARHFGFEKYDVIDKTLESDDQWILETIIFEEQEDGSYRKYVERHVQNSFKLDEVKNLLHDTGFSVEGVYSSFEFEEVEDDDVRWFFVCKKS